MADEIKKESAVTEDAEAVKTADAPDTDGEKDTALESFLSRDQQEQKLSKQPMKKSRKTLFIIIGAVVLIAALIVLLIVLRSHPNTTSDEIHESAELTLDVNADGVHEASVGLDENGQLKNDGAGTLLQYATADIKQIDVENEHGTFTVISDTPEGEATVYTIKGFEDYDLQSGVADEIATHSATIEFSRVIKVGADPADYGLDHPRATVKVQYKDDTSAVIRIGNEAAGEAGTYMSFGTSDTVYLISSETIESYLYSVNGLISLTITDTNEDSENAQFSSLTISGTHFDKSITLATNKDDAISASYLVTSPVSTIANAIEASDIAGNIRGLYAESVVCVNPSADQLASYGLSEPYATVKASYPDTDITLHASAPDDSGIVNIYNPDKNVIYTIQLAAVCWAKTSLDQLMPENPLPANMKNVGNIRFSDSSSDYSIDVKTVVEEVTADDGSEQQTYESTATCDGKDLNTESFNVFFQNLNAIKNQGKAEESGKDLLMTVTLTYTTDRSPDTLKVYSAASNDILELNGTVIGTASKSYIESLIKGAHNLIKGETVEGL